MVFVSFSPFGLLSFCLFLYFSYRLLIKKLTGLSLKEYRSPLNKWVDKGAWQLIQRKLSSIIILEVLPILYVTVQAICMRTGFSDLSFLKILSFTKIVIITDLRNLWIQSLIQKREGFDQSWIIQVLEIEIEERVYSLILYTQILNTHNASPST